MAFLSMISGSLSASGRLYVTVVAAIGIFTIANSVYDLYARPIGWDWFVLAILTLVSGSATVKLPAVPATISISETFVFTSVLLFGVAAGTLTVALDALVISLWLARRGHPFYRIAFNVSALPAALWVGARLFYWAADIQPLSQTTEAVDIRGLLGPLVLFTLSYFLLNSWLIAFAISLEKKLSPLLIWRNNFAWLSLNYFGGASIAALLVTYTRDINYAYLVFVLPLLAVLYFTFATSMGRVEDANRHLSQLNALYMSTIETLAMAIDAKDQITHGHIRRVQRYAVALAQQLGVNDAALIRAIEAASLLHDMGKLAVPEYILNKPGPLTRAEFDRIKLHASVGADILSAIEFPYPVVPIVRHHHESWDGTGYPDGLKGSAIPIGARILSVVDCFDALTSDRPYRPRLSDAEAISILLERRGTMYDPLVVDTFLAVHGQNLPQEDSRLANAQHGFSAITDGSLSQSAPLLRIGMGLEDISASTEETLVLYEMARALTGRVEVGDIADVVSKYLRRILPASTCVIFLYDESTDELVAVPPPGDAATHFAGLRVQRGQRLSGWVGANKQTIVNSDPMLDLGDAARTIRPRLRSALSTPILVDSELLGVLSAYSVQRDAFADDHRRVIEVVARQVAQTLRHVAQVGWQRQTTPRQQLYGLPTLKDLEEVIESETAGGTELSILLVEVHLLKATRRDTAGEADEGLATVVAAIRGSVRSGDTVVRYGETSFVVLLLRTESAAAQAVAARIRECLAQSHVVRGLLVRVNLGQATAPVDGGVLEGLLEVARQRSRRQSEAKTPPSVH